MGLHFQRGQVLFDLKRYREAAEAYRQELAENPDAAEVHAVLAAALINCRQINAAEQAVGRAIDLNPELAYGYYILSFVELRRRRFAEAEGAIAESVRLRRSPEAFHQWGLISRQRGKFPEAIAATAEALQLNPHFGPAILLRGKLLAQSGRLPEAHALFSMALAHNPQNAAAHHALGSLHLRVGDAQTALDMLREARRLDPLASNDSNAIAQAYGEMLQPLQILNRGIFHWNRLPVKRRWICFTIIAALFALTGVAFGSSGARHDVANPAWVAFCILLCNYAVVPFTFDWVATALGAFFLRREFGMRWRAILRQPIILFPAIVGHVFATLCALTVSSEPSLGVMACLVGAAMPLLSEGVHHSATRSSAYLFCIFLFIIVTFFGSIGAIILMYGTIAQGAAFLVPSFAIAFFSDDISRWITSFRFRSGPLLNNKIPGA